MRYQMKIQNRYKQPNPSFTKEYCAMGQEREIKVKNKFGLNLVGIPNWPPAPSEMGSINGSPGQQGWPKSL